ncbi:MAG: ATP-binding protein [Phycisphaerales bacterium]|jgi:signal transduction histidine kinase
MTQDDSEVATASRTIPLRTRLTLWVLAVFLVIQVVTALGFWFFQRATIRDIFEQRFLERSKNVQGEIEAKLPNLTPSELSLIATQEKSYIQFERFEVDVVDAEGNSVVSPEPRWPKAASSVGVKAISAQLPQRTRLSIKAVDFPMSEGQNAEVLALPVNGRDGRKCALLLVTTDAFIEKQVLLLTQALVAGGLFGLLATTISGWFIAGIAVEPLRRFASAVGQLSPERIDEKMEVESWNTETRQLAAELDAARERMRDAFAAQERFLSNISHEIKTPIATLLTQAQTLDKQALPANARDFVEMTEEEMRKLGGLVESFLTLTRVRDGKGVTSPKAYVANELVMDAVEDCLPMADQYAVRLVPTLASHEDAMDIRVMGAPSLLRTMLNNLVRNAIRFSPRDGKVTVAALLLPREFTVAIRDQGPGVPEELIPHIFDRFVQAQEEIRRGRGHGLGLAIAKGIAELHQGDIAVRNLPEGGAEFKVTLPV